MSQSVNVQKIADKYGVSVETLRSCVQSYCSELKSAPTHNGGKQTPHEIIYRALGVFAFGSEPLNASRTLGVVDGERRTVGSIVEDIDYDLRSIVEQRR